MLVAVALRDLLNPDEVVVGGQAFTGRTGGDEQVEAFTAGRKRRRVISA